MNKITFLFFILFTSIIVAQENSLIETPEVDKRVELLSITFRLAGSREYNSEIFKLYTDKIKSYYSEYKDHELIEFIKKIRQENGVSYDAVMKMAVHLDEDLNPRIEFNEKLPEPRWGKENAYEFVRLLKKFYRDSNSEEFFQQNQNLYREASQKFLPVYENLDLDWYTNFYGKEPNEKFIIINGLGNGGGNYGPSVEKNTGKKEVYAIMGAWNTDENGMVEFPVSSYFPTLLHEFNHSFVNELLMKNTQAFKDSGETIYEVVEKEMNNSAYRSWETMMNEALVRAAVIKYMKDHNFTEKEVSIEILEQKNRGFLWIEDLVEELENYDKRRDVYPTLETYIPELAKAYVIFSGNIEKYIDEINAEKPHIVSISEFENGSKSVNAALKQISLNFDRPFAGANFIKPGIDMEAFPSFTNLSFSEDRKTAILNWNLEEGKDYEFILIGLSPGTSEASTNEDYVIKFSTK